MIPAPVFSQNMMMTMGQNTTVSIEQTTHYKRYHGDGIDDVLRLVPTASVFGLKMLGVEAESSWKRRIAVSVLSFGVNAAVTYSLKKSIHKMRPDGTDNESFPSGHTCASIGAALAMYPFLERKWGIPLVILAVLISLSRLYVGVHYPTDVLGGAVVGAFAAWGAVRIVKRREMKGRREG